MKRKTILVYLGMGCMTLLGLMVWAAQEKKPLDTKERKQMHTVVREIHEEVMKHGLDALKKSVAVLEKRQNEAKAKGKMDEVAVLEEAEVRVRANVKQWSLHAKVYPLLEKNKQIIKEKGRTKEAKQEVLSNTKQALKIYRSLKEKVPDKFHASLDISQLAAQSANISYSLEQKGAAKVLLQEAIREQGEAIALFADDSEQVIAEKNVGKMIHYQQAKNFERLAKREDDRSKKLEARQKAIEMYATAQRNYQDPEVCDEACSIAYMANIRRIHEYIKETE